MAEYPQPRRPRRRPGENRAALLEAAVFEFGEHGYHGASTAAIAAQADVPQPHVYVHFATKGELFLAALVHAYDSTDRAEREGSPSEVAAAVRAESLIHLQAVAAAGEIGALINNACFSLGGLNSCGYEDFEKVLRVGVVAPFYLTKLLMPHFAPGAAIVNIASTRAFMSQPDTESYSAAKGGIIALTHAMSATLAGRVRVNAISPGWIDTGAYQHEAGYTPAYSEGDQRQHPSGRVGRPEDIARMALYLCSDAAGFIDGENITIDGGMTKLMIYHNDYGWKLET